MLRDQAAHVAIDLVTELEFTDLLHIVAGTERLRALFGYVTKQRCLSAMRHLPDLRNDVMHPARQFLGRRRDAAKLIEIDGELRMLIATAMAQVRRIDRALAASLVA